MEVQFLGQGLENNQTQPTGNILNEAFLSGKFESFSAFVAFVSAGGLKNILDNLSYFRKKNDNIKLFIGVDLNATSKEALELLLTKNITTYIVYSPNSVIYHPKVYILEGQENKVIIGSSNLTISGLFQNMEASVAIDFDENDEKGINFLADIYDYYNEFIDLSHQSCQLLTQDVLDILVESKIVLPEKVVFAKNNQIGKEYQQKDGVSNEKLLAKFAKIKKARPPKGYKKIIKKQEFIAVETENLKIIEENIHLENGSMWIETGKMTGGSRNILDLSKKGKLNGETKFGSVSYFGIDPENDTQTKDINIVLGEKQYNGNHIFYAEGNSNWRIRINGVTSENEKITAISKSSLGNNGGFQNKILLFSKLDETLFKLEILEKEEMDILIENSEVWAKGGNESTGRAYGITKIV